MLWRPHNLYYEKFADGSVKCIEEEIPFELPNGWAWARLASLIELFITGPFGSALHKSDYITDGIPLINPMNIVDGKVIPIDKMQVSPETVKRLSSFKVAPNDIVIARRGDMGRCAVIQPAQKGWLCGTGSFILRIPAVLRSEFFAACLRSPYSVEIMSGNSIGNTMLNLNQMILKSILMPVPPCAEQNRIINAVFDTDSLLATITAQSEELVMRVKKTKSKILDLAIRGKLVPQDPSDEPASVLLERIRAEKEELIKQGKIKRDKKESVIFKGEDNSYYEKMGTDARCIDSEIPFDLPETWCWCRLGTLFAHNTGKALNLSDSAGTSMTYITTSNLYWDRFELDSLKEMPFTEKEVEKCTVTKGDLLVCEGGDVGRSAIWMFDEDIRIQNHIHRLRPYISLSNRFYYYVMFMWKQRGLIGGQGIGLQGFSSRALHNLLMPLPPVKEQAQIAAFVDDLFETIENIEKSLS